MDTKATFEAFLRTLDASPLWSWDAPPWLWGSTPVEDVGEILLPLFGIPDPAMLPAIAANWGAREDHPKTPVERLFLIASSLRGDDEEQRVVRECVIVGRDAEFLVLHMDHDTKEVTEYDFMREETPAMAGMRAIGFAAWPIEE